MQIKYVQKTLASEAKSFYLMNACSNMGAFILEMSLDTLFVVFCKFDLRSDCFDQGTFCVWCVQDIGQSGQTGVYVVCLQEQNAELEPV